MRKNSGSMRFSGVHTSPGTPEYGDIHGPEPPKHWSSERVPVTGNSRSQISSAALIPFNSGRVLPSKWDDAERWITSPISAVNSGKSSVSQPQTRPKSKSGPLAPPLGHEYLPQFSPTVGDERIFITNSSFVVNPDAPSLHQSDNSSNSEMGIIRSSSLTGLSELLSPNSLPVRHDANFKDEEEDYMTMAERGAYCRDVGTQMSPSASAASSPRGRLSFSAFAGFKDEIRDVQVDKGATSSRRRRRDKNNKESDTAFDLHLPWTTSSRANSKLQREEAKITAWENLQKAKAEAAIRKLEMNLEKKRSAAMDKITSKLRGSQMKAEAMRMSLSVSGTEDRCPSSRNGNGNRNSDSNCNGNRKYSCACFRLKSRRSTKFLLCRRI